MKHFHLYLVLVAALAFVACNKTEPEITPGEDQDPQKEDVIPASAFNKASEWSVVGTVAGGWDKDIAMKTNGTWHAAFNVAVQSSDEFKFRKNKNWDVNFGASSVKVGAKISLATGGDNIKLPAGNYDMYLSEANQIAYILTAGTDFTHGKEGEAEVGGELYGDYDASLAPANKKSGITYQLNVYSFADSDGDGWGDFQGIINHLDYLDAIGATALWLSPINDSQSYHAYDIKDYFKINPKYGSEAKLQELITKAKEKNIDIYIDYVLNHSGDQCSWFKQAKADKNSKYRSYYVFADPANPTPVDNFAGQTYPNMGSWNQTATYSGLLHFKVVRYFVKVNGKDEARYRCTVTPTTQDNHKPNKTNPQVWIFTNDNYGMNETSTNTYELTLNVNSNWGFLVRTSTTSWDAGTKWGSTGAQLIFGKEFELNASGGGNLMLADAYFGSFDGSMPDLSYGPWQTCQNSDSFQDLAASADKWINMGVNGLRLDAVMWIYQCHTDANVKFLSEWYNHCNATYKARGGAGDIYMVGEAYDWNADVVAPYYKGLPSLFDFAYYGTVKDRINRGSGSDLGSTIASIQTKNKNAYANRQHTHSSGFLDAIKLSNHDENRVASELGNHEQKKRLAGAILLTSPGKPFIYQGEELGYWGVKSSGDENVRQPINWTRSCSVPTSWCSFDKSVITAESSVEAQAADNRSLLQLYRHFAYARNTHSALAEGAIETTSSDNGAVAAWYMKSSSEKVLVMHNLSGSSVTVNRGSDKLDKIIVSNKKIEVSGSSVTLPAYSSVVFQQ